MTFIARWLSVLYRRDDKQGPVEVALVLALVAIVAIAVAGFIGAQIGRLLFSIAALL